MALLSYWLLLQITFDQSIWRSPSGHLPNSHIILYKYNINSCNLYICLNVLYVRFASFQKVYVTYIGQLKRIDSVKKSPIYAHFDESIVGSSTIRAYRKEDEFIAKCDRLIDESQRPFYLIASAQRYRSSVNIVHLGRICENIIFKSSSILCNHHFLTDPVDLLTHIFIYHIHYITNYKL